MNIINQGKDHVAEKFDAILNYDEDYYYLLFPYSAIADEFDELVCGQTLWADEDRGEKFDEWTNYLMEIIEQRKRKKRR